MKLTNEQKNEIREMLQAYVGRYPSQNKAANSLTGISAGTVSTILNGRYESISDEMFVKLRAQISGQRAEGWQLCRTRMYQELSELFSDAQQFQNVAWAIAPAGSGKTTTARDYASQHENVFVIPCSEDMHRIDFIREMSRALGIGISDRSMHELLERITRHLLTLDRPLLIFDEGDKLSDTVFYYFITIYNRLENYCGIVFISTRYIKRRMEIGLAYNKKGYDEIHSRICRKFIELTPASSYEVAAIVRANGITDDRTVNVVVKDAAGCEFDLRRVRREVHKQKRLAAITEK